MFCGQCGTEVKAGMDFCPNCGSSLKTDTVFIDRANESAPSAPAQSHNTSSNAGSHCNCGWAGINVFAVLGFALSFVLGIPGLVFSIMGYQEGERTGKHKGLAIAGIVISIISIIMSIIVGVAIGNYIYDESHKTTYPYL